MRHPPKRPSQKSALAQWLLFAPPDQYARFQARVKALEATGKPTASAQRLAYAEVAKGPSPP